jgi:hypothetical protein
MRPGYTEGISRIGGLLDDHMTITDLVDSLTIEQLESFMLAISTRIERETVGVLWGLQ